MLTAILFQPTHREDGKQKPHEHYLCQETALMILYRRHSHEPYTQSDLIAYMWEEGSIALDAMLDRTEGTYLVIPISLCRMNTGATKRELPFSVAFQYTQPVLVEEMLVSPAVVAHGIMCHVISKNPSKTGILQVL